MVTNGAVVYVHLGRDFIRAHTLSTCRFIVRPCGPAMFSPFSFAQVIVADKTSAFRNPSLIRSTILRPLGERGSPGAPRPLPLEGFFFFGALGTIFAASEPRISRTSLRFLFSSRKIVAAAPAWYGTLPGSSCCSVVVAIVRPPRL